MKKFLYLDTLILLSALAGMWVISPLYGSWSLFFGGLFSFLFFLVGYPGAYWLDGRLDKDMRWREIFTKNYKTEIAVPVFFAMMSFLFGAIFHWIWFFTGASLLWLLGLCVERIAKYFFY